MLPSLPEDVHRRQHVALGRRDAPPDDPEDRIKRCEGRHLNLDQSLDEGAMHRVLPHTERPSLRRGVGVVQQVVEAEGGAAAAATAAAAAWLARPPELEEGEAEPDGLRVDVLRGR